ncbi:hypothetical protein HD806DRAFT_315730 [Xylariaceae sp. AK1471]|nr:hypothetical protein HD806DRAFT_315730 [Xylariaceae sp. AK1471]
MGKNQQPKPVNSDASVETSVESKKRVITAARKEQNKLAQRAYRRRQKELKKLQRQTLDTAPRRLEPRRDNVEGSCILDSSSSSRRDAEFEDVNPIGDPLCSQPLEAEELIHSDLDFEALQTLDPQVALNEFSPSSIRPDEATAVPSAPISMMVPNKTGLYPPALDSICLGVGRSLEDNRTAVLRACLSNAICIGINLAELMFCEQPCMSPFYRPMAQANADPAALIVTSSHDSLPVSLKPTPAQILIPHHASLDLIPLPRLRERAILMSAALPHIFSLWDMKLDIYTRDALICQDRHIASQSASQPWDMRSWQAAPWFLNKWKMVVDTDEVNTSFSIPGIPGLWM